MGATEQQLTRPLGERMRWTSAISLQTKHGAARSVGRLTRLPTPQFAERKIKESSATWGLKLAKHKHDDNTSLLNYIKTAASRKQRTLPAEQIPGGWLHHHYSPTYARSRRQQQQPRTLTTRATTKEEEETSAPHPTNWRRQPEQRQPVLLAATQDKTKERLLQQLTRRQRSLDTLQATRSRDLHLQLRRRRPDR